MSNCTLKVKVDAWQRIIRRTFAAEAEEKILFDPDYETRKFSYTDAPSLSLLKKALDKSMMDSADEGRVKGMLKAKRTPVAPSDLRRISQYLGLTRLTTHSLGDTHRYPLNPSCCNWLT